MEPSQSMFYRAQLTSTFTNNRYVKQGSHCQTVVPRVVNSNKLM